MKGRPVPLTNTSKSKRKMKRMSSLITLQNKQQDLLVPYMTPKYRKVLKDVITKYRHSAYESHSASKGKMHTLNEQMSKDITDTLIKATSKKPFNAKDYVR